jgi:hypothetical protein
MLPTTGRNSIMEEVSAAFYFLVWLCPFAYPQVALVFTSRHDDENSSTRFCIFDLNIFLVTLLCSGIVVIPVGLRWSFLEGMSVSVLLLTLG